MLDLIRKKQKSVIIKVVFWTIIAAFVGTIFLVWGKGGQQGTETSVAAVVNDEAISYDEYQSSYSNLYRLYQNIYRDQFTPALEQQLGLKSQALQMLIEQTLLAQEADSRGIKITRKDVIEAISRIPAFQDNGVFSKERYLAVLNYQRLSPETFEAAQERELRIEKLREELQQGIEVTEADIEEEFRQQNEKVELRFLRFAPAFFESKVEIDENALQEYFNANREQFRLSERIALQYLQFEPARYLEEAILDDQDLKNYYEENLDKYDIDEQVRASHILIKVNSDANTKVREQKKALAEDILDQVKGGGDFAALARKFSDDPGSAVKGGDLGLFARGVMVAPFENTAFALAPGEVSDLVQTQFGYHIIKVTEHVEAGVKELSEVVEEVQAAARKEKALEIARDRAWAAYSKFKDTGNLEQAAEANNLGIKETGLFTRDEAIDGIGRSAEIAASAFALSESKLAKPVDFQGQTFLFNIKERQPSRLPELGEVKAKVEAAYRQKQSRELAKEAAEKSHGELMDGAKMGLVAKEHALKIEETGPFSRTSGAFIPRLGTSETLAEEAFKLSEEQPVAPQVYEVSDTFVVAALNKRQAADMAALDPQMRQQLSESLLSRKKEEILSEKIQQLREAAEIKILVSLDRR